MSPEQIAAYIGAAAWFPPITSWIHNWVTKPKIVIVPDKKAEIGFTSYGPIFNLRMMLTSEQKSIIMDGFEVTLRHHDGDEHTFRWTGLLETFSEITDDTGNKQVISKDQTPIALKLSPASMLEKFIRFQEQKFHDKDRPLTLALVATFNHLKNTRNDSYVNDTIASREFSELIESRKSYFHWKAGEYKIIPKFTATSGFTAKNISYSFELTSTDIQRLRTNLETMKDELENIINSNLSDHKPKPINWNWASVEITSTRI